MLMTAMKSFKDDNELFKFIDYYIIRDKLPSLEKDVNHCLSFPYAPFPAILFCFSIIDLLASLYCGQAHSRSTTSDNAKKYMKEMMKYTEDQCNLLQKMFRHKLVHLASPRTVFNYKGMNYTWHYAHDNPKKHLSVEVLLKRGYIPPPHTIIRHEITHRFWIGIKQLAEDIEQSFLGTDRFYAKLKAEPQLRLKFDDAVFEMFSPVS